jgi:hypothetical protein
MQVKTRRPDSQVLCVVRDGALHRKATIGAHREGHGGLPVRRIVRRGRERQRKTRKGNWWYVSRLVHEARPLRAAGLGKESP